MDLLGGCNSDSDSDSDDNNAPATTTATIERSAGAIRSNQDRKLPPPTSTAATTVTKAKSSKADKKKRVVGKKLLKLSAILPEHILNQLQLSGGGGAKDKYNENSDDDTSDDSSDDDDDDNDDDNDDNKKASSRRKTTTTTTTASTAAAAAASPRDYSRDEGIMGLLSALSKSNSSSSSRKQAAGTKILGSDELFSSSTEQVVVHNNNDSATMPSTEKPKSTTSSEPLGAAFLTTTVETITRKRKEPSIIRSIHDRNEDTSSSETRSSTSQVPSSSATSVHTTASNQASSAIPRPFASPIAPPRALRVKATSSLRSAAPRVGIRSTTAHSLHNQSSTYTPVTSLQHSNSSHEQQVYRQKHQQDAHSVERGHSKKKKPLSRKRQMEQMLRAGKLDQVQGDHELQGVAHLYQQEGDLASAISSSSSSNNNNNTGGAGVRVVPTGTYDASLGATAMSTDVSSRQKNSNQLNSLLANAASLENHRAQNPQFNGIMGVKGKSGSHRANAKTKYGW